MNDDAPRATSIALPALLEDAARRSAAYLRSLEQRLVRPDPDAVQRLVRLEEPLPAGPNRSGRRACAARRDSFRRPRWRRPDRASSAS
jgi:hypothetical protein